MKKFFYVLAVVGVFGLTPAFAQDTHSVSTEKTDNLKGFQRLKKKDILTNIIGKVITDESHWSDHYLKDGTVVTISMGSEVVGKWLIKDNSLCIISKSTNECYEVWQLGTQIELRVADRDDPPYMAVIKDYKGHQE